MRRWACAALLGMSACGGPPEPKPPPRTRPAPTPAPAEPRPTTTCSRVDAARGPSLTAVALRGGTTGPSLQASCGSVKSRAGRPVDEHAVDADVRELFATGLFEDVVAVVEESESAATLVYEVKPRPRLADIAVRGEPRDFDLSDVLGKRPAVYDPVWVRATDARLLEALHEGGYRKAKVDHEVTPTGDGALRVRFWIEAGKRFVLGSVRFEGLVVASADLLRKQLRLTPGEPAFDDRIERDRLLVALALYEVGLVQGEVAARVEENFLASTLDVVLTVREGPVFKLGTVKVTGPAALPATKYRDVVARLPRGTVFARSKVAAAAQEVEAMHRATGTERNVAVSTNVDASKRTIDVELNVQ